MDIPQAHWSKFSLGRLPRRVQSTGWRDDPPIVDQLIKSSTPRTQRLLNNSHELEREVIDSSPSHGGRRPVQRDSSDDLRNGSSLSGEELQRTLGLARRARSEVPWNSLTEEFHQACEGRGRGESLERWKDYKKKCRNRHAWGEYFRSNLDWDWDLAGSLKQMYKLPRRCLNPVLEQVRSGDSQSCTKNAHPQSIPIRPTASLTNGTLEAVFDMQEEPVEHLRVAYRLPTGEIAYRTFRVVEIDPRIPATDREDSYVTKETSPESANSLRRGRSDPRNPTSQF